jgi:DNA/RNA-binding domain of Phe-tRNA-synthetase-like protein
MITLHFDPRIARLLPDLAIGCIQAEVVVTPSPPELSAEMELAGMVLASRTTLDTLHDHPAIEGTREAYKVLGKEPSRYRPSAEALQRRVLQGKGLYYINNIVDVINLLSLRYGYSIGGWDLDRVQGDITLGIGQPNEPYETIGRGEMNIAGFPVMRDRLGAFGTPTSDSERTSIQPGTRRVLLAFYAFEGGGELRPPMEDALRLLQTYGTAQHVEMKVFTVYEPKVEI